MNINGNKEQEDEVEKEEKVDENEQDETNDCSKEEKQDDEGINEEEEEEQRRRDELEMDDRDFTRITGKTSTITKSTSIKEPKVSTDDDTEDKWSVVQRKPYDRRRLIKYIIQNPTTLDDQTVKQIDSDLWQLQMSQRYDLYRYWLLKYQQYLHYSVREARQAYNQAASALAEYHQEEDYYILKDSIIVAMTTTCAAKYHNVLEKLQSKIVIVEEAAAIFEAHIITALSTKCEHLILIGDHVQLRPSPSVYKLAQKYQIDVSLFERFIKNNFPNVRLNTQ
ncbi:unnamed protein product, partial [Rotaria magnacalcarata]